MFGDVAYKWKIFKVNIHKFCLCVFKGFAKKNKRRRFKWQNSNIKKTSGKHKYETKRAKCQLSENILYIQYERCVFFLRRGNLS